MSKKKHPSQGRSGAAGAKFGATKQQSGKNIVMVRRPPRQPGR